MAQSAILTTDNGVQIRVRISKDGKTIEISGPDGGTGIPLDSIYDGE